MPKQTAEEKLRERISAMDGVIGVQYQGLERMQFVATPRYDLSRPRKPPQVVEVPRRILKRWQDLRDQESIAAYTRSLSSAPPTDAPYLDLIVDRKAKSVRLKDQSSIVDFSGAKEQWQCFLCHYDSRESGVDTKAYAKERGQSLGAARAVVSEVNRRLTILRVRLSPQRGRRKLVACK